MDQRQMRAFEGFAAESGAELLRIATLLTPDRHTAEDVYQETLQRLAARWSRVDNPKAFCRQVMLNVIRDQARARARRPRELELLDGTDRGDPRSADPYAAVELRPSLRALFRVLAGMPAVQVDPSARDMLGRRAVKISWTASDTTVYTVYENPANGTVLEQAYKRPADMDLAPGYDLMLRVTRTNTIPPDPYTS